MKSRMIIKNTQQQIQFISKSDYGRCKLVPIANDDLINEIIKPMIPKTPWLKLNSVN